jgi:hypothetical protein
LKAKQQVESYLTKLLTLSSGAQDYRMVIGLLLAVIAAGDRN